MKIQLKHKVTVIAVSFIAISLFGFILVFNNIQNARFSQLIQSLINENQIELASALLSDKMIHEQDNPEFVSLLGQIKVKFAERNNETEHKWITLNQTINDLQEKNASLQKKSDILRKNVNGIDNNVTDLKNKSESFHIFERQQWVSDTINKDYIAKNDYLFLLVNEKKLDKNILGIKEIDQLVEAATRDANNESWENAKNKSLSALRADPINAKAAAVYALSIIILNPEDINLQNKVLPVAETICLQDKSNFQAIISCALIYKNRLNFNASEKKYRDALAVDSSNQEVVKNLAYVLIRQKKYEDALFIIKPLYDRVKSEECALLVWQAMDAKDFSDKRTFLESWQSEFPSSQLPWLLAGDLYYSNTAYSDSLRYYKIADQKKTTKEVKEKIANLLVEMGNNKDAIPYLRYLVEIQNIKIASGLNNYKKYGKLLVVYDGYNNYFADAVEDGIKYLKLFPDELDVIKTVGDAHVKLGNYANAVSIFKLGLEVDPNIFIVPFSEALLKLRQYNEIEAYYQKFHSKITDKVSLTRLEEIYKNATESRAKK